LYRNPGVTDSKYVVILYPPPRDTVHAHCEFLLRTQRCIARTCYNVAEINVWLGVCLSVTAGIVSNVNVNVKSKLV